jgi:nucleoredoxin
MSFLPFTSVFNKHHDEIPVSALDGKPIALYFSTFDDVPNKVFTNVFGKKYKESEDNTSVEIIFISVDETEHDYLQYCVEMPWYRLGYDLRKGQELMKKYQVQILPSLVFLDLDGSVLLREANILINRPFKEWHEFGTNVKNTEIRFTEQLTALKASKFNPALFLENLVLDKNGEEVPIQHFQDKIIGFYFCNQWYGKCRTFTTQLAEIYQNFKAENKLFEIIFISSDRTVVDALEFYKQMPWLRMRFEVKEKITLLKALFRIKEVPSLVFASVEHGIITNEGQEALLDGPFEEIILYNEKCQRRLDAILAMPTSLTITEHEEHPLMKIPTVYDGEYICNLCEQEGKGWVFHCELCQFDVHPRCMKVRTCVDE